MKKVTAIIPCYNEEKGIAKVVRAFPRKRLAKNGFELDVIVVDNNSRDRTAQVATASGARVLHETRQGKGHAIRRGFNAIAPDTDFVVMLDGDQTYKPQEILRLIEPLESKFSKVVIGSRIHGRMRQGSMKLLNRLGNYAFSAMVKLTYRVQVTDVLTGYFAWSRDVIEQLRPCLTSDGFAIEMEMITKMAKLGHEIYSVPITYDARAGESNLRPFADGSRILGMYLRSLMWRAPKPKPLPPQASCASKQQDYVSDDA